jgi:hypothetical protein
MAVKLKGLPPSSFPPWGKIFPAWEENVPSLGASKSGNYGLPMLGLIKKLHFIQTFS